jgi:hypothetical protein
LPKTENANQEAMNEKATNSLRKIFIFGAILVHFELIQSPSRVIQPPWMHWCPLIWKKMAPIDNKKIEHAIWIETRDLEKFSDEREDLNVEV